MIKLQRNIFEGVHPVTQYFNENPKKYAWIKDINGDSILGHNGIDFGLPEGTPLYSPIDGFIVEKGWDKGGYGKYVRIRHNDTYKTAYAHMKAIAKGVKRGKWVLEALLGAGKVGLDGQAPAVVFGCFLGAPGGGEELS